MNVGLLRDRVKVIERVVAKDEYGAITETLVTKYELLAYVKHLNSSKRLSASEVFTNQTLSIVTYVKPVKVTDLIEYNGSRYEIIDIIPSSDLIFMSIMCQKINT